MLFNSFQFALFFPLVVFLYVVAPHRLRWVILLLASCVFYMAFIARYILILGFTIVIDYCAGLVIERSEGATRRRWLIVSILANCGVLALFKYYGFFRENLAYIARALDWNYSLPALSIILPIGLSFHTFQAMSYTIEVYRGNQRAECHFGIFALYVMFFPQLVAGPIERPQNLLHQFHKRYQFDYEQTVGGLRLMLWGFFKKIAIADNAAIVAGEVFDHARSYHGAPLLIGVVMFAFQIYGDFSGYSDIARGAARILGFDLMRNFDCPYFAVSIPDFWRRWHISLSTWFRDYLYIPLGGNRTSLWRRNVNLLGVFLISGLWHGASWTFVLWGALHGFYVVVSRTTTEVRDRIYASFSRIAIVRPFVSAFITFMLVCVAWTFFRANRISDAFYMVGNMFVDLQYAGEDSAALLSRIALSPTELVLLLSGIVILLFAEWMHEHHWSLASLSIWPAPLRWAGYYAVVFWLVFFGFAGTKQFIYFQF